MKKILTLVVLLAVMPILYGATSDDTKTDQQVDFSNPGFVPNNSVDRSPGRDSVGDWIQCASQPTPELGNATGYDPVNDHVYSFSGSPDGAGTYNSFTYQYDHTGDAWATVSDRNHGCDWIDASYVPGYFYIIGGYTGGANNWNQRYDIGGDAWTDRAALPVAKHSVSHVAYNDSLIYVLGGRLGSGTATSDVRIYNTFTNAWTVGTSMPNTVQKGNSAIVGDTIYHVSGWDNAGAAHANIYKGVINPTACETITWTTGPALPYPVAAAGVAMGMREGNWYIYMVGGYQDGTTPVATAYQYAVATSTWTQLPDYTPFPITRGNFLANRDGHSEIYVCGGDDYGDWGGTDQVWRLPWLVPGVEEKPGNSSVPFAFGFAPNMTNPARGNSSIQFTLTRAGNVTLNVYDRAGRIVSTLAEGNMSAGLKTVNWDTHNVASGVYSLTLKAEDRIATHRLIVVH